MELLNKALRTFLGVFILTEKLIHNETDAAIKMKSVVKRFPGVTALKSIGFEVKQGEVRALLGKNGAGKSTLIKIITGVYSPDAGEIVIFGKSHKYLTTEIAYSEGIRAIYQESDFVSYFTVAEAVMLGTEPRKMRILLDRNSMNNRVTKLFDEKLGYQIDPNRLVKHLTVAEKQLIQIARSLLIRPRIMIFDEPTAPLSAEEIEKLFNIIRNLRASGVTIIYISHRLEEIFEVADTATILRDGEKVADIEVNQVTQDDIIRLITGGQFKRLESRKLDMKIDTPAGIKEEPTEEKTGSKETVLKVKNLRCEVVNNVSFSLCKGEILGLFGAEGAGQEELMRAVYGLIPKTGVIEICGRPVNIENPADAIRNGIAYVAREREENLVKTFSVSENTTLPHLNHFCKIGCFIDKEKEKEVVLNIKDVFSVVCPSIKTIVAFLSGGNQQKIALAKWFISDIKVLLLDYPTMGVDIQAKQDIYRLLRKIVDQGTSVVLITPEYEEIKMLCDRVVVLREGCSVAELDVAHIDEEMLLKYAIGTSEK